METVWFCLVALMIAVYVLLDGFDLGAGAIRLLAAKTEEERRQILASIGRRGWQRSVARGGGRHAVFCVPCALCQRL